MTVGISLELIEELTKCKGVRISAEVFSVLQCRCCNQIYELLAVKLVVRRQTGTWWQDHSWKVTWGWAWHTLHPNTWRWEPCSPPWTHTCLMLCLLRQVQLLVLLLLVLLWLLLLWLLHLLLYLRHVMLPWHHAC